MDDKKIEIVKIYPICVVYFNNGIESRFRFSSILDSFSLLLHYLIIIIDILFEIEYLL